MADPTPHPHAPSPYSTPEPGRRPLAARLGWVAAWALSVALAFVLGLQSRDAGQRVAQPAGDAATAAPAAAPAGASSTPGTRPSQDPKVTELLKSLPRRDPADPTAKGRVDAKVVLIEWSDYRCPFCAVWARKTLPQLQRYIDDGTLRIEYRDLPIFGDQSTNVAIAARAAGRQGRFWPYYDAVFANAPTSGHPEIGPEQIQQFAKTAQVPDLARFTADLNDPTLRDAVYADAEQAQKMGLTGTPFFVINTTVINGAQPTESFVQAIESARRG